MGNNQEQNNRKLIFQLTLEGKIIEYKGNYKYLFKEAPKINNLITHYLHILEGFFPVSQDRIFLPNIELNPDMFLNIELRKTNDKVLLKIEDNSKNVSSYRRSIQEANELFLKNDPNESILDKIYPEELFSETLYHLSSCVYEYLGEGQCRQICKQASWMQKIHPELCDNTIVNLTASFPFLESFFPFFDEFIRENSDGKKQSELWTENDPDGKELLLQCIGIVKNKTAWIVLVSHETILTRDKEILQKAREQKLFTEQLEKAKKELQKLLSFKDQFVSIVSHDLRSPVSSVVSATDMMLSDEDFKQSINELYLEFLETINKDMKLLLDYNEKLYYWSNLQLGKFKLERKDVSLKNIIRDTKNRFHDKAQAKNILLKTNIDQEITIHADESLFAQVMTNLTNNALKFTPPGGTISISAININNNIIVSVADTGIGIKKEVQKNLFKGYVKDHTDGTNGEKGSGLGLGICKRILDAHEFPIFVESEINKGTTFNINIPVKKKQN